MQIRTLYICRGTPGSGKSSLARVLAPHHTYAADDLFETPDGGYDFDPARLREAHEACLENVAKAMQKDVPFIAVHNTMSQAWEAKAFYDLARRWGYSVFVIEAQNDFGNVHGVPDTKIQAMRDRWEPLNRPAPSLWRIAWTRLMARLRRLKNKLWAATRTPRRSTP